MIFSVDEIINYMISSLIDFNYPEYIIQKKIMEFKCMILTLKKL